MSGDRTGLAPVTVVEVALRGQRMAAEGLRLTRWRSRSRCGTRDSATVFQRDEGG
jgi:hypothetical protein